MYNRKIEKARVKDLSNTPCDRFEKHKIIHSTVLQQDHLLGYQQRGQKAGRQSKFSKTKIHNLTIKKFEVVLLILQIRFKHSMHHMELVHKSHIPRFAFYFKPQP